MKNLFVISESEKERILGMHRTAIKKQYLGEALTDVEPVSTGGIGFKVYFDEGKSSLPEDAKTLIVNQIKQNLKSSMKTIEKFYDSEKFDIPKFIEVGSATSSTGSRERNASLAQKRIDTMVDCIYDAFDELGEETGNVVGADYIKKFLTTNTDSTYEPTGLKKLYDANKSAPKASERFAYVLISPLQTKGHTASGINKIEDLLRIARGWNVNPDEEGIAKAICKLETYSDIEDIDTELRDKGGLEYFINTSITNGLTSMGSDTKERRTIKACLNKASNASDKGDIADIAGDKLTIIGM